MSRSRILAIDDEPSMLKYYREFFRLSGKDISTASSVDEALICLEAEEVSLVILDLEMPGRNGAELFDWLCKNRPDVWVIIVSAFVTPEIVKRVNSTIHARIQTKPCSISDVCDQAIFLLGQA